jgi:outer membrane receptor protein involved in Fe transport
MITTYKNKLLATTLLVGAGVLGTPAAAQQQSAALPPATPENAQPQVQTQEPLLADNQDAVTPTQQDESASDIVVTGSRIVRPNLASNSPIAVVTGEELVEQGDITLDTFLNTLPQVNPAGTTTSNNPGNGGQSNVDLRGLGSNRNLVLIDGRRPMVSASDQTVDLNTIPQGLIERIEIVTGGAGATYGADAIAGAVNIRLRDDFQGLELRGNISNSLPDSDAREYQISGLLGANFADGRGNIAIAAEYSARDDLGKLERDFAATATSTTGTPPTGRYVASAANAPSQAAINAVFAQYGVPASAAPTSGSRIGFNTDGTLFGVGVFNRPESLVNFRYAPNGLDAAAANQNFAPDFYSYNFDRTNLLVLPLKRKSVFLRGNYEVTPFADFFMQGGYTEYNSQTGLAATPVGTTIENPCGTVNTRAKSILVNCFNETTGARVTNVTGLIAPITNPFIPADLRTLLNSRTGNDPALAGTGAAEGVRISKRFLDTGLRLSATNNQVLQGLVGLRGDITDRIRYEVHYSYGRTIIDATSSGNVNVQRVQELLESPTGGTNLCAGGFNPFGIQPLSPACVEYIEATGFTSTRFTQKILQGFVNADLFELPAGAVSAVVGAERRRFRYAFDPGLLSGPIAGFNTSTPDLGTNSFTDFFGELLIPIAKDTSWARSAEINLTARRSKSDFNDIENGIDGSPKSSWAYGITASYQPITPVRVRASYQRSVRAPNFGELFSGGGSFPQYFDPCSVTTNFRQTGGAAATLLCNQTGLGAAGATTYVQTPGSQAFIGTNGNTNLDPEVGKTFTIGTVFQALGFTGSLDFYRIKVTDTISAPTPNVLIAACYGYFGINSSLSIANPYCSSDGTPSGSIFIRTPDIAQIIIPETLGGDGSYFQAVNQGFVKTSGLDLQLGYRAPMNWLVPASSLSANLMVNRLLKYQVEELPGLVIDYAGTASYFGAGLGTSFPKWRANLNLSYTFRPFTLETRIRYIGKQDNRASRQFPGETFTGPDAVTYFDFAAQADLERRFSLRFGLNNAFNKQPPTYSPNVQSGTDPSLYDVIGRRAYVQAILRF